MRKLLGRTLFLSAAATALLAATAFAADTGVVNVDALRLRSDPSTDAAAIARLKAGAKVDILEDQGEWYKVEYNGSVGYLFAEYVSPDDAGNTDEASSTEEINDAGNTDEASSTEGINEVGNAADEAGTGEAPRVSAESVAGSTGVITARKVNFRSGPSTDDAILTTLTDGTEVTIVTLVEDWCQVQWNGGEGYIKADYISVDGLPLIDPRGLVTGSCVNMRGAPTTEADVVTKVYGGNIVELLALEDDWYLVSYNGQTGYIRSDFLRVYTGASSSGLGANIVATARQYIGTRYSYGGASSRGFDCSGFTMYVFSQYGYSLPHSATSQWNSSGTYVSRAELEAGDLVLFCDPSRSNGKACSHVGIYVGDGDFIHASTSSGVIISSLYEGYYNRYYIGGKRVV